MEVKYYFYMDESYEELRRKKCKGKGKKGK